MRKLRHVLKLHKSQLVFFMKTKLNKQRMESVRCMCGFLNGFEVEANGT